MSFLSLSSPRTGLSCERIWNRACESNSMSSFARPPRRARLGLRTRLLIRFLANSRRHRHRLPRSFLAQRGNYFFARPLGSLQRGRIVGHSTFCVGVSKEDIAERLPQFRGDPCQHARSRNIHGMAASIDVDLLHFRFCAWEPNVQLIHYLLAEADAVVISQQARSLGFRTRHVAGEDRRTIYFFVVAVDHPVGHIEIHNDAGGWNVSIERTVV